MFIHSIQTIQIRVTYSECPTGFIVTTALDICTLSRPIVTSDALCQAAGGLRVLEQVRRRCRFVVIGCVVTPEHVHQLFGEPERLSYRLAETCEWMGHPQLFLFQGKPTESTDN
ncbi:MAG: hypothetical protein WB566_02840 [Terriglobales bacterium]